ncbi:MAG: hypothetical protein ACOVP7_07510 [Lacibacter sp.]|uniref:Beta-lactamase-inhibitor-like PepSY-like domain-containing protein n=1 Tax=Lacibacter luteus TaxID=2508719 RepID=A0A4Q1CJ03_9BACT|nr:hypothetical protein [Lacibacter luteus]RXK60620.1 hypothetical protein ESA94_09155 [Lacibacter luteus]
MKKIFVMLTAVVITASAWASPSPKENEKAKEAFQKEFSTAKEVNWTQKDGYYLVSFKFNNDWMTAWYTDDGQLQATQRSIQPSQMTFLATKKVEELGANKTVLNIAEISKEGELFYLVKIDDDKCVSVYKMYASGEYSRISKTKKKTV